MNKEAIKKHLNKKIKSWLHSIKDKELKNDLTKYIMISGGAISSLISNETPNDYDIYLSNIDVAKRLSEYYTVKDNNFMDKMKERNRNVSILLLDGRIKIKSHNIYDLNIEQDSLRFNPNNEEKYQLRFISSNAISLTDGIQIILRFVGTMEEIHTNFDFIHNKNYYEFNGNNLVLNVDSLMAIMNKQLIYSNSKYPICSMFRIRKFMKRGYTISAGEMLKIAFQINELDLTDIKVLKDQLLGVDAAYFNGFLNNFNNHVKSGKEMNYTTLQRMIDKVYDKDEEYES